MNGKIKLLLVLYFLLLYNHLGFSQISISGKVTSNNMKLEGATIIVKSLENKIISYVFTDDQGMYLTSSHQKSFMIEAIYLGFEKEIAVVKATEEKQLTLNFDLQTSVSELQPITINHEKPITSKGDTLIFDAKKFTRGHEQTVQDLLKNIPGILINKDGKIFFNEQPIEKVMVEGDDLFNKGYTTLTQNMPSKPLNKIEVVQNYSNNKLLKGIEDSNNVALNLTLEDSYKNIWFGNTKVGMANSSKYLAQLNLMNFTNSYKSFITTSANNGGYDDVGNLNDIAGNSSDVETIGLQYYTQPLMNLGLNTANLGKERTNFNDYKMVRQSTILPIGKNTKVRVLGNLSFDERTAFNRSTHVTALNNLNFTNNEINQGFEKISNGFINFLLNHDFSKNAMFQFSSTFNTGKNDFENAYTFNTENTTQNLISRKTFFENKATYTYQWKKTNAVLIKTRYFSDKIPQHYKIDNFLLGDLFANEIEIEAIASQNKNSKEYVGINAEFFLKQQNSDMINFNIGFDRNDDALFSRFKLLTDAGSVTPFGFQTNSLFTSNQFYAISGYKFQFNTWSVSTHLDINQVYNKVIDSDKNEEKQQHFYINPFINIHWDIKNNSQINARIKHHVTNLNPTAVNGSYILQSANGFSKGLGRFDQLDETTISIDYSNKHYLNRYGYSISTAYSSKNTSIITVSEMSQTGTLSNSKMIKGGDQIGLSFGSHYVSKKLSGLFNLNLSAYKMTYFNEINNSDLRKNTLFSQNYTFKYSSSFKIPFNFSVGIEQRFSKVQSDFTFSNTSAYNFLHIDYNIDKKWLFTLKTDHYNFGKLDDRNNYIFSDLKINYLFAKEKFSVGLDGRNLFNTKVFRTYHVSDYGYTNNEYNLLPRYIFLLFNIRL